jgi:flagellar basal-body rod modification protein FlgD
MVDAVTGTSTATALTDSFASANGDLGKNEFLQLLVAQLRNQDPLDPMKDADFIAQMSQFSSLEQLINMNDNLSNSMDLDYMTSQSISNSMATSLLGKTITANTNWVNYTGNEDVNINYSLAANASEVKISILNEDGAIVQVMYDENSQSGMNDLAWDGKYIDGTKAPIGNYQIQVEAMAPDGTAINSAALLVGTATKVQYINGAAYLMVNNSMIMLGDVLEVEG